MSVVIVGIDEAGYGPLLGPLCVGMSAFTLEHWNEGDPHPDLWRLLAPAVCRNASDKRRRIAIDDSKKLRLPADSVRRHPLCHLERAVLASAALLEPQADERIPLTDTALFARLTAVPGAQPWYAGDHLALPVGNAEASLRLDANALAGALQAAGISIAGLRCCILPEDRYNDAVRRFGGKAATTELGFMSHLRWAFERHGPLHSGAAVTRVVCDRQGGRVEYGDMLHRFLAAVNAADPGVQALEEAPARSRYLLTGAVGNQPHALIVSFQAEGESAWLPIALASMVAKYTRELSMLRFNRHFAALAARAGMPELKPTAGYWQDAQRWLTDLSRLLSDDDRRALLRIA
ncbi:MAG: hypothetical protein ACK5ZV_04405 [bacterium]|jgi:hypothetical protein